LKFQFVGGQDFNASTKFTEASILRGRYMVRLLKVSPRLPVRNLARTVEFYTSVLDFETGGLWPAHEPTFVILERDDTVLQFHVSEHSDHCGFGTISIDTDDARSVHAALTGKVTIEWGPEVYWYGRREFSFRDPDGYAVIISEQTSDPPDCTEDME
jgi:catechol 2,3-dioxygenase-like lactoylglutathione lyase family enzyme